MSKTSCHDCPHSSSNILLNSAHIKCALFWANKSARSEAPAFSEHGKANGWYDFPYDYDPIWQTEDCKYFKNKHLTDGMEFRKQD